MPPVWLANDIEKRYCVAKKYSLWFIPSGGIYDNLANMISWLSKKYSAPCFEPHVTLLGNLTLSEESILLKMSQLVDLINTPLKISLTTASYSDEFFRSLFVKVEESEELMVVWQVNPEAPAVRGFRGGQIYAQRLSPTGEQLWPEAIRVYENPSLKSQAYSSVVSDGIGGVIITSKVGKGRWPDLVYAQRIDSDGNHLWGEEGIRINS